VFLPLTTDSRQFLRPPPRPLQLLALSAVSKRFRKLMRAPAVWCDLDLSSHASFLTDRIMLNIMRNDGAFGLLRSICLSGRAARKFPFQLNLSRLH